jgi:hypothetical protein
MWGLDYGGDHEIKAGATQVPTFYSGITTASEYILPLSAGMAIAMVFGGIHCVAWSFQPPSHAEQLLWRISSLTITCIPALEFVSMVINANPSAMWIKRLSWVTVVLALILYIIARFMLLVLPFMALRSLSPDTYQTVQWTTFIPHV